MSILSRFRTGVTFDVSPTMPTPSPGDNSTKGATTAFVTAAIAAASGSMAIGAAVTSGTAGSVLFVGTGPVLAQDNSKFFWDVTNHRLGLGTASPSYPFHLIAAAAGTIANYVDNSGVGVQFTTDSSGRISLTAASVASSLAGAYFTADGYEEAWINLHVRSNTSGKRWFRFGGLSNYFAIQTLNDAATSISTTPFKINFGAPDNSFYMDSAGKVGMGTASPTKILHLFATIDGLHDFLVENSSTGTSAQARVTFKSSGASTAEIGLLGSGNTQLAPSTNALFIWNENASDTIFGLGNAEKFRMKSDGKLSVSVGTAPTALVDIAASTTSAASLRIRSGTAPTSPNDGDVWYDGTHFWGRAAGVTKQLDN